MDDLAKRPIPKRFEFLLATMTSDRFLKMEGLGNEVPFFICPYEAEEELQMERVAKQLRDALANQGHPVLLIDLYELSIALIKARGIWEDTLAVEASTPKDQFLEHLQSVLDSEHHLIPAIRDKLSEKKYDVLFLVGVGAVYPYIRSHTILNNLQSTAKDLPTVLFFPGEYKRSSLEGSSLNLFGRLSDDNYYRAFNIYQFQS